MTQVKNFICDKTKKNQIVTKLKEKKPTMIKLKNSNRGQTQKLILWQLKKTNCAKLENSNCGKTEKIKLWQNTKTQIVTKLKNSNCDISNSDSSESSWSDSKNIDIF